jgi:two-component system sensor histidine kinase DesK
MWSEIAAYHHQRASELGGETIAIEVIDETAGVIELPGEVSVDFLRSVLELVRNAVRHADARRVRVTLAANALELRAEIEDDGSGLPAGSLDRAEGGLANIRHRVTRAGGRLAAKPGPSTRFELAFPVAS